jgi:hypothetical protein
VSRISDQSEKAVLVDGLDGGRAHGARDAGLWAGGFGKRRCGPVEKPVDMTRRHVARLGDLTDDESSAVGRAAARLARALTDACGAEWVYSAVIGTGVPHFHLHQIPRYPATPRV